MTYPIWKRSSRRPGRPAPRSCMPVRCACTARCGTDSSRCSKRTSPTSSRATGAPTRAGAGCRATTRARWLRASSSCRHDSDSRRTRGWRIATGDGSHRFSESSDYEGSGDFAGGFAPGPVMAHQVLYPAGWGKAARLVRFDEQPRESPSQAERVLRGEVDRQLVQQADELTHVRRSVAFALDGEPALQPDSGDTAGKRSLQKTAQPVGAHTHLASDAPQGEARRLPREPVPQQWHREGWNGRAGVHVTAEDGRRGGAPGPPLPPEMPDQP